MAEGELPPSSIRRDYNADLDPVAAVTSDNVPSTEAWLADRVVLTLKPDPGPAVADIGRAD